MTDEEYQQMASTDGDLEAENASQIHAERENPEEWLTGGIYDNAACHCVREHNCGYL